MSMINLKNALVPLGVPIRFVQIDETTARFEFVDIPKTAKRERERCAKLCESFDYIHPWFKQTAKIIREGK